MSFFAWGGRRDSRSLRGRDAGPLANPQDDGVAVEDVPRFARGVARMVLREHWRRPDGRRVPLDELASAPAMDAADDDILARCLDRCLDELAPDGRGLILEYYGGEGGSRIDRRKRMAQALGASENALRSRAQRLRDQLERCITRRMASPAGDTGP